MKCCGQSVLWETIGGALLVYRVVDGRKVYRWRCRVCSKGGDTKVPPR